MNIGATNCCGGDPKQCIQRTDIRHRLFVKNDPTRLDKYSSFHLRHYDDSKLPCSTMLILEKGSSRQSD